MSLIIHCTLDFLYAEWNHLLVDINQPWMTHDRLESYCEAVVHRGSPLTNIIGFIDVTARSICRPIAHQRLCFSGHKRVHALKFQSVMCPDGILAHMFGPIEGRRHDAGMLQLSGLLPEMQAHMRRNHQEVYSLYGDPAYPLSQHLLRPFSNPQGQLEAEFNRKISSVRQCVEWGFMNILQLWAFVDFKKTRKVFLCPVAKYFAVSAPLVNCYTWLYGNDTSAYFGLKPPSLEEYLQ